jgi:biopolymer transport protein TolQ
MFDVFLPVIATTSPYYVFQQSDGVGQAVVFLLFLGSILTWTIMVEKGISLFRAKKASEAFINTFRDKKYALGMLKDAEKNISPVARVCEDGVERLMEFYNITPEQAKLYGSTQLPTQKLTTAEVEAVRTALEREVSDQILELEDKIGLLATAVSVSPFFGLFGTVWGIMVAFAGLASQGRADIAALAPGVSGALLTTVVGLLVAIPSLIGYNLLTITIRKITVYMDNFVEEFLAKIKLEQLASE